MNSASTTWLDLLKGQVKVGLLMLLLFANTHLLGMACVPCVGVPPPPVSIWTLVADLYATSCIGTLISNSQLPFVITVPGIYTLCEDLHWPGPGPAIFVDTSTSLAPTLINMACHRLTSTGDGIGTTPGFEGVYSVFNGTIELLGLGTAIQGIVQNVDNVQLIGAAGFSTGGIVPINTLSANAGVTTRIRNCDFRQLSLAIDLLAGAFDQTLEIDNCTFDGTQSTVGGSFMILGTSNVTIRDCIFSGARGTLLSSTFNHLAIYNTVFQEVGINDAANAVSYFNLNSNTELHDCAFSNIEVFSTVSNLINTNNVIISLYNTTFQSINLDSFSGTSAMIRAFNNSLLNMQNCNICNIFINGANPATILNILGQANPFHPSEVELYDTVFQNLTLTQNSTVINIFDASVSLHRCTMDAVNNNTVGPPGVNGILAFGTNLSVEDSCFTNCIMDSYIVTVTGINLIVDNSKFLSLTNGTAVFMALGGTGVIRSNIFESITGNGLLVHNPTALAANVSIVSNIFNNITGTGVDIDVSVTQSVFNNIATDVVIPYNGVTGPIISSLAVTTTTGFYTNIAN